MYVEQSYFDEMNEEIKTVEARPYYPSYHGYAEGDSILFISPSREELTVCIEKKTWYRNFECMLRAETVPACLPGLMHDEFTTALSIYHSFRDNGYKKLALKYGVIAFKIKPL